jgi:UDP-2,3-diacylglucosamine pyrophosphatase LpxH
MLVILSDLHFTDETVSADENVPTRAFEYLADDLRGIIENSDENGARRNAIEDVEVLLLGDVFDMLRSARWKGEVMPWSPPGPELEERVGEIMDGVCEVNAGAFATLRGLKESLGLAPEKVKLRYVAGNHDRTVNLFASTRRRAVEALGLDGGEYDPEKPFPTAHRSREYNVIARHGNQFDALNWGGEFTEAGLGEAVVVKLINGFPENLRAKLEGAGSRAEEVLQRIAEIDHVRPLWAVPRWVRGVVEEIGEGELRAAVEGAWSESVAEFLESSLVRERTGGFCPWRPLWWLRVLLKAPWGAAERVLHWAWARRLLDKNNREFVEIAAEDREVAGGTGGPVDLVVYGHTHIPRQVPLDVRDRRRLVYFNSGTWRKTVRPAEHGSRDDRDFIPWEVMSYLVLYRAGENRGYRFEMWQGMRGKGGKSQEPS